MSLAAKASWQTVIGCVCTVLATACGNGSEAVSKTYKLEHFLRRPEDPKSLDVDTSWRLFETQDEAIEFFKDVLGVERGSHDVTVTPESDGQSITVTALPCVHRRFAELTAALWAAYFRLSRRSIANAIRLGALPRQVEDPRRK